MSVRVRFAPSPTGHLHIGGARSALFNYLYAKKQNGTFILRIEDTDQARNKEHAEEGFIKSLRWLGIPWDEGFETGGPYGPYRCMDRLPIYQEYADRLLAEGKAYRCYCTEEEIEADRQRMLEQGLTPKYSGRCRHLAKEQEDRFRAEGRKSVVRFLVPEEKIVRIHDKIRGDVEFETNGIGDFVIVKSDGIPTYNFAVVVDDALMKITLVIRGEEHLTNTPRQILVFQAFGFEIPEFAHCSLILNEQGKKLSKRDESIVQFIEQYKDLGYLPEALFNYLALLGWSPGTEQEIFSHDELVQAFSIERISKSGSIFDQQKLAWMNSHYIKQADVQRIVDMAIPFLQQAKRLPTVLSPEQARWVTALVQLLQEKLEYVAQIVPLSDLFFTDQVSYPEESMTLLKEAHVPVVAHACAEVFDRIEDWSADGIKQAIKEVQKETGYKGKQLFMPIRIIVTGQEHGPDLNQTLYLLGKQAVVQRLRNFETHAAHV
ncbi:glutamate--tRNA ligase [Fodinisporobacter ferrooxydans]|uniref:glutamate--tRNA ligase n=1 Tax=Fodinisporobacter ferrooxydans TaxID=2901836 RepID=UPI003D31DD93